MQKAPASTPPALGPARQSSWHLIGYGLLASALAWGLWRAFELWWVGDDAFISFRYARNLINGHGLVFNVGERVEGYTNFLWTVMIAAGMKLGAEPIKQANVLGMISFGCTGLVMAWIARRLGDSRNAALAIPFAAAAFLAHLDSQVFATSGLETMWTTLLVTLGFALTVTADSPRKHALAGLTLTLAALSRPDALLFPVLASGAVLLWSRQWFRAFFWQGLPLVLIYVPYWLIRYSYYGDPFPNTYYAKSAWLPWYTQGWKYLSLYLEAYKLFWVWPALLVWMALIRRNSLRRIRSFVPLDRAIVLLALFIIPFVWYVVRTGGDFMFARFLIVVTPLALLTFQVWLHTVSVRPIITFALGLLVIAGVMLRDNPFQAPKQMIHGIANEPDFYPAEWIERAQWFGTNMAPALRGSGAKVGFLGMYAVYMYYSESPYALETSTGLTDREVAHMPLTRRGRPGHEKETTLAYLQERGVSFWFRGDRPNSSYTDTIRYVSLYGFETMMITFQNDVMDHLKQFDGVRFIDVRPIIDRFIEDMPLRTHEQVRNAWQILWPYYFRHNNDPARERPFRERLGMPLG